VLCEEGAWIAFNCNCVDCEAICGLFCLVDYEVIECVTCKRPSLYVIKFHLVSEGEFEKDSFHGFGSEPDRTGEPLRNLNKKRVRCMKKNCAVRCSKLISSYGHTL